MYGYSPSARGFFLIGQRSAPSDLVPVTAEEKRSLLNAEAAGKRIEPGADGRPVAVDVELTQEQIKAVMSRHVQRHLDAEARTRNYDGILSLCTYATSSNTKFAAEGQAGVEWRDAVWSACYAIMDAVLAGQRAIPTKEQLLAELPPMAWPESQPQA